MSIIRNTGRPGATYKLIDRKTGKTVLSTTADTNGIVTMLAVPPGQWFEQISYTVPEGGGVTKTITSSAVLSGPDFEATEAAYGPLVTASDGSLWQIGVVPVTDPAGAPTTGQATTGGSIAAGTYTCGYTWVTPAGESKLSPTAPVTTTTATSTITLSAIPALPAGVIGWNMYISAAGVPGTLYKQNANPLTGVSSTQTAAVSTTGAQPPASSSAGLIGATKLA